MSPAIQKLESENCLSTIHISINSTLNNQLPPAKYQACHPAGPAPVHQPVSHAPTHETPKSKPKKKPTLGIAVPLMTHHAKAATPPESQHCTAPHRTAPRVQTARPGPRSSSRHVAASVPPRACARVQVAVWRCNLVESGAHDWRTGGCAVRFYRSKRKTCVGMVPFRFELYYYCSTT